MSKVKKILAGPELRTAGWKALVKSLGVVNATRYMLQYEPGHGDYAAMKKALFKGRKTADILKEARKYN